MKCHGESRTSLASSPMGRFRCSSRWMIWIAVSILRSMAQASPSCGIKEEEVDAQHRLRGILDFRAENQQALITYDHNNYSWSQASFWYGVPSYYVPLARITRTRTRNIRHLQ